MVTVTRHLPLNKNIPEHAAWLASLPQQYNHAEVSRIHAAYECAKTIYVQDIIELTGILILDQGVAAAHILAALQLDHEAVCAALLFYAPRYLSAEQIQTQFGLPILRLLQGVQRVQDLGSLQTTEHHLLPPAERAHQAEAVRKMMLAMVEDMRVVLIKLAWRTQTMHSLSGCTPEIAQKTARETLDVFAPLANRLGIWQIKWALEDLSLRYLDPVAYKNIVSLLDEKRTEREAYIEKVMQTLKEALAANGIQAEISGRVKHIYSIYRKMQKKRLKFEQLFDVRAVRILVSELKDCYSALGVVHQLWKPIPGEFDDYISQPKGNNYQSLHTVIIGPDDKGVEIQIRTHEMHQHAEYGVAAHWRYKEGGQGDSQYESKIAWLRQLIEWRDGLPDSSEGLTDKFKTELFNDTVYVLTPQGKVVGLPAGSTPLDFAYHIHTDLGHRCRGAKVNGHIAPLHHPLQSGDRIEILSVKQGGPSLDWLRQGYLKSHRAQSKVRAWIRAQNAEANQEEGRQCLERALQRLGHPQCNYETLAQNLGFDNANALYLAIGQGEVSQKQLDNAIVSVLPPPPEPELLIRASKAQGTSKGIIVNGVGDLMTSLAKCCKPVYGDSIVGYVTRGRGVSVHRSDCPSLKTLSAYKAERLIAADWGAAPNNTLFAVDVQINAQDRPGLLRDISDVFARDKINVTAVQTQSRQQQAYMRFTLEVRNPKELEKTLRLLEQLDGVWSAQRTQ